MTLAAQLFTLRDFTTTAEGLRDALRRCSQIGFPAVQLSAVGCMNGDNPSVTAQEAKQMLDEFGLRCCATHRPWPNFKNNLNEEIEFHQALGCTYAAVGSIQGDFGTEPASYTRFLQEAEPIASQLEEASIHFGYHNHSHEFARNPATRETCYELLVDAPWLQLEVDTYWVANAGLSPERLLDRLPGRIQAVHLKDMEVVASEGPVMAPVGDGNLNWPDIMAACHRGDTQWLIVEQDTCRTDPFDCLDTSYRYLFEALSALPG